MDPGRGVERGVRKSGCCPCTCQTERAEEKRSRVLPGVTSEPPSRCMQWTTLISRPSAKTTRDVDRAAATGPHWLSITGNAVVTKNNNGNLPNEAQQVHLGHAS